MSTRRKRNIKKRKTNKKLKTKKNKTNWVTAVGKAQEVFTKTGSYDKAREQLRNQSIINARKLFGSLNERL